MLLSVLIIDIIDNVFNKKKERIPKQQHWNEQNVLYFFLPFFSFFPHALFDSYNLSATRRKKKHFRVCKTQALNKALIRQKKKSLKNCKKKILTKKRR